jgi:hypothetical protein
MPNDPDLVRDTCIFMEAVSGDGGAHTANVWWLSPDIILNGPVSGPDKADPGQINPVQVRFHRKGAASNCIFPGSESATVELWVGNPSIAMAPNNPASTTLVQMIGSPLPTQGGTGIQVIDWTPPSGLAASNPQSAGHKCLVARCYPDDLAPSTDNFYVPDDQHVAQRNICIVPCDGPGAAKLPGPCGFKVTTANLDRKKAQRVRLKAVFDQNPSKFVRETVLGGLRNLSGFKRLSRRMPQKFGFELREFPDVEVNDRTRLGCLGTLLGGPRSYAASINLEPAQVIRFDFVADLSGGAFGDAYIFHLTQTGPDNRVEGGLTIVMVS